MICFISHMASIGFEESRHWVLLADPANSAVGWLQSADRPATALAVVSPRRFRARITGFASARASWPRWPLAETDRLYALCVVSKQNGSCVMNLRAPILINLDRKLGCQLVTSDEQPLQAELTNPSVQLRKSA